MHLSPAGASAPGPSASSSGPQPASAVAAYSSALHPQPDHMGPSQPPHDMSHDPRMGPTGQAGPQQQQWEAPQWRPPPVTGHKMPTLSKPLLLSSEPPEIVKPKCLHACAWKALWRLVILSPQLVFEYQRHDCTCPMSWLGQCANVTYGGGNKFDVTDLATHQPRLVCRARAEPIRPPFVKAPRGVWPP